MGIGPLQINNAKLTFHFSKQTNLADIWIADGNGLSDKSRSTSGMFKSQLNSENCSRDESSSILTTYVVWCNFEPNHSNVLKAEMLAPLKNFTYFYRRFCGIHYVTTFGHKIGQSAARQTPFVLQA